MIRCSARRMVIKAPCKLLQQLLIAFALTAALCRYHHWADAAAGTKARKGKSGSSGSSSSVDKKLADYEALRIKQGGSSVVKASEAILRTYVQAHPRSWDVFVLFTATPAKYKCTMCALAADELELAASSYFAKVQARAGGGKRKRAHNSTIGVDPPARPALFLLADLPDTQSAFRVYEVRLKWLRSWTGQSWSEQKLRR